MRKLIRVTKDRIKRGQVNHCGECPIALAIKEGLKINSVSVRAHVAYFCAPDGGYLASSVLPAKVSRFIYKFDDGQPVKPFKFLLKW